ncbi:MAG: aldo/keto reductase [Theionarchaea archaeon]|nr:aldo/keto reductase [Theionarchaea archaeon]
MEYRTHKGCKISEVGVGCYSLAGVYGKKDVHQFKKMLLRAVELGVNFFDTAEGYGDAEHILGGVMRPYREEVIIATKVGIKGNIKPNLSAEYLITACDKSLDRLKTDYIDLYQVHFDDPTTPVEETVGALEDLVVEGKIRHYGVGHLPAHRIETYCETGDIFSILMELSAVSRYSRKTLLPLCSKYEVGGIAFSTTGRGLLTGKIRKRVFGPGDLRNIDILFQRENFQSGLRIAERFSELGEEYNKTPVQVAIAWVLSQPGIICALTGPSTIPHLEENIGGSGWSLSQEHCKELEILFKKEDQWLKKKNMASIREILSHKLPGEFSEAFADLIFVLETAMLHELVTEKEILPLFYKLFETRKEKDVSALENIQEQLSGVLKDNITDSV